MISESQIMSQELLDINHLSESLPYCACNESESWVMNHPTSNPDGDVLAYILYQSTKFQPVWPSHLWVYVPHTTTLLSTTQLWITNTVFELLWSPDYFFSRWWLTLVHVTTDRKLTHYCRYHKIFMVIFSEHDHSIQINAVHYETYRFLQEFLVVWILASILGTQGKKEAGVIGVPADRSTNYN